LIRTVFTRRGLILVTALIALLAAACGGAAPNAAWPGLATNDHLAFVAYGAHTYAVDLSNGRNVWTFPQPAAAGSGGVFSFLSPSTPVPNGTAGNFFADPGSSADVVLVAAVRPGSSHNGVVFGLDPATGEAQWCLAFNEKGALPESSLSQACEVPDGQAAPGFLGIAPATDDRIIGGITITDSVAYFGLASGWIFAVEAVEAGDTKPGTVRWSYKAEHAVWAAPRVTEQVVYVTSLDHLVYALDRSDGELKWKTDLGAAIAGTPAVADGMVYIGSFDNQLHALDAATGQEIWPYPANNWVWGGPVVQDGVVYFTDLSGTVFAVDAETGTERWTATLGGELRASPAVTEDTLYVGSRAGARTGKLFALNLADGATRWSKDIKGELLTTPVVLSDTIVVALYQGDNLLEAYTTAGEFQWPFRPSN